MKKLLCSLCLASLLLLTACNSLGSGVKTIAKCCKQLSGNKTNETEADSEKTNAADDKKGASLLPSNSWDSKMMIW